MDKEKDLKKIVAVVLVLILILGVFIFVRSCTNKQDEPTPVVTPTPTEIPTPEEEPEPTATPSETARPSTNTGTQTTVEQTVNEVEEVTPEVTPTPTEEPAPVVVTKEQLQEVVESARTIQNNSNGSSDSELMELVNALQQAVEKADELLDNENATSSEITEIHDEIILITAELNKKVENLIEVATAAVEKAEEMITVENVETAKDAIKLLPNGEVKTALKERLEALSPDATAYVSNITELDAALLNSDITAIYITASMEEIDHTLEINRSISFNANNYKLSFISTVKDGMVILANDVTVNDLTIEKNDTEGWEGHYGLQVYNATGVVLNNYTGSGADGALLVNASSVTLTGITTVSGNEFGGIEVSKGTASGLENAALEISGSIVNETEAYGKPTVWLENGQGSVSGTFGASTTEVKDGQTQYYLNQANANKEVLLTNTNVKDSVDSLNNGDTLTFSENVTVEELVIEKEITIDGSNNTLDGKLVVSADNVIIKDIILTTNPEITGSNVTLDNVTISGSSEDDKD